MNTTVNSQDSQNKINTTTIMYIVLASLYGIVIMCLCYKRYNTEMTQRINQTNIKKIFKKMKERKKITPVFIGTNSN